MHWNTSVLLKNSRDGVAKKNPDQLFQFKEHTVKPLEDRATCL